MLPPRSILTLILVLLPAYAQGARVTVVDASGAPVPTAMVMQSAAEPRPRDTSDGGYQPHGKTLVVDIDRTTFTAADGAAVFPERAGPLKYRVRKYGYQDAVTTVAPGADARVTLRGETDPEQLAASLPANAWLGALVWATPEEKKHFQMQCAFCHQFGTSFTRRERSPEEWRTLVKRMVRYGSRLPTDLQKVLPEKLSGEWARIKAHPEVLAAPAPWSAELTRVTITEWPLGDSMSQMHDMVIGENGLVYVADNIQDRVHEIDVTANTVTVYKIPHREGEENGGLIAGRLRDFPRHDSTSNAHSLAVSKKDGHIFLTPSAQRRLVEFDPQSKQFTLHEMEQGFYPHTIRIDGQDRVWFTLALSNQIAMFDRPSGKFTYYDLPNRNFKEMLLTKYMHVIFKLIGWGLPLPNWLAIDWQSTGTPLPYGIDVAPDGTVWFARLHTQEIGFIRPATGEIVMVPTPFLGPRRLRVDAAGDPWIVAFGESSLAHYAVAEKKFEVFPLPVTPAGSEAPYALNVDKQENIVWVNGNQSDAIYGFDMLHKTWLPAIPLPRRTSFTRDIEIAPGGAFYTSNSNFPSWHIEDGQPTLIYVERR